MFLAAVIQMTSTRDIAANREQAFGLIERAASYGASLVATPENTDFLGPSEDAPSLSEPLDGPTCRAYSTLAGRLNIHLLLGSFHEATADPARCRNTSVLFGPSGATLAIYRKIHLFDVDVPGSIRYRESDRVIPGDEPVVARTPLGTLGLTVCYDLRFGALYRRLVADGAELIAVPAAFTATTGRAHWEALLRARAIECQAYVLAPAQHGRHDDPGLRESYGHAMIVDPWGQVVASVSDGTGLALAEIDLERVQRIREAIPVAVHTRPFP